MTKNLFPIESLYPERNNKRNMKIGALYALLSVITWSVISVITRFCLLNYEANILVFASMQIFAGGVALLLIRKPVTAEGWKAGVGYSWLYTLLQIFRNFFLAAVYLYITSTETSLLINIEVVVTAILAYIFFKRSPHSSDITSTSRPRTAQGSRSSGLLYFAPRRWRIYPLSMVASFKCTAPLLRPLAAARFAASAVHPGSTAMDFSSAG